MMKYLKLNKENSICSAFFIIDKIIIDKSYISYYLWIKKTI